MRTFASLILIAFMAISLPTKAQWLGVKTNLLYDATSTINLGVEVGLAKQWSFDLSGNYNPWTFSDNKKTKMWMIQPEARWWTCERFLGQFIGVHLLGGQYNWGGMMPWGITNDNIRQHRYEGWAIGAGVSYGYQWILGKHWSIEATLGIGYARSKYDKYKCQECGERLKSGKRDYFGPTKAGITLIYMIK